MRPIFTLLLLLSCFFQPLAAQFNATLISNLNYDDGVNDIWGYTAPDGTEYALVGLNRGVSVVSLADPKNPVEVGRTTGVDNPWRDIKTYGTYAYVTADRGEDGLTVIDLSNLPESISFEHHLYTVPGFDKPFARAHNIYIDTTAALAFTAGGDGNVNAGGILIFDLKANPAHPPLIAMGPSIYSHDVYVQDSIMYTSDISRGELSIYDIRELDDIKLLGRTRTPFAFTHNAWTNAEATTVFTTDEKSNASVAAYDIRDYNDIKLLDEYRPLSSLNTRTIPHNVHVIDDYLSISHYTDGLRVVDASDPSNLIEVANYDTWPGANGGYNGNWGAFPFLPSGLTLVSDRSTGLYVIDVNYVRAARLEGTVTDRWSGAGVNNAMVHITADQLNEGMTDALGSYKTGLATAGTYRVIATAAGYLPDTLEVTLTNGTRTQLDIVLEPIPTFSDVTLTVKSRRSGLPLDGAVVKLQAEERDYTQTSSTAGSIKLDSVQEIPYTIYVTAFGYLPRTMDGVASTTISGSVILLDEGYADGFVTDLGWKATASTEAGWQRVRPGEADEVFGDDGPGSDSANDLGDFAYLTAIAPDADEDVVTTLESPNLDLSDYTSGATLFLDYFLSGGDSLVVSARDKTGELNRLAAYTRPTNGWKSDSLTLPRGVVLEDSSTVVISAKSGAGSVASSVVGFDNFRILRGELSTGTRSYPELLSFSVLAYPNPTTASFTLQIDDPEVLRADLRVYTASGQLIHQRVISGSDPITFGADLPSGLYFATLRADGRAPRTLKLLKR
ncbi:choice-of-anchor B domain-containing protein [Lewinella aquimaris]|uniref:Choice-of-anchor B domain-containing protein n=1 Tax=Neolewinella aquimaris TaxID=1835722 RepID=A0A840E7T9_9BACT|nr:choice-of-anchor B family protein [Neolewinella aquimaris]MBB4078128.1 choice-of-anchor B domain-containing protein [Neolewinella aquimaris]